MKPASQPTKSTRRATDRAAVKVGRLDAHASTLYLRIAQGLWTKQVSLGARAVGWPAAEVDALNAARIAGKTDGEIRALVLRLEAARAAAQPDSIFAKSI
jgi:prophage regulatory protein